MLCLPRAIFWPGWTMSKLPLNALIAIGVSLLPMPALLLVDRMNSGCGDGLCTFVPGIAVLVTIAVLALAFMLRSARVGEKPAVLLILPAVILAATLTRLMF